MRKRTTARGRTEATSEREFEREERKLEQEEE